MAALASGTRVDEIADALFRISTPVPPDAIPGGFSFNQYLLRDDEPLLFHTGPRRLFRQVAEAVATVLPVDRIRWVAYSHFEADECGALNEWLAAAPGATPACSRIGAMTSASDVADRPPRPLADGEALVTGRHELVWVDAPHLPHGWDCGYLFDRTDRTLLCGDLFTQPGAATGPALTRDDVLGRSEALRHRLDYFSGTRRTGALLDKLAALRPARMACMHGQAWEGDGAALLRALGDALARG